MIVSWSEVNSDLEECDSIEVNEIDGNRLKSTFSDVEFNTMVALSTVLDKYGLRVDDHMWVDDGIEVFLTPDQSAVHEAEI
jgi:hypothetical protein